MGYSNIRDNRRHEADAARIRELEAELKKERVARLDAKTENHPSTSPSQSPDVGANGTVTVERTSKRLKGQLVASWVAILLGICVSCAEPRCGAVVLAVGFFALVYTKILIWWRHG